MLIDIKTIKNDADLDLALGRIDKIIDAPPGTPEAEELHILSLLVRDYEEKHYPVELPDPIEAIKVKMEDMGLEPKDLEPYIGNRTAVSYILNRQRPLSKSMIRSLYEAFNIPLEVLFQEYELQPVKRVRVKEYTGSGKLSIASEAKAAYKVAKTGVKSKKIKTGRKAAGTAARKKQAVKAVAKKKTSRKKK